MTKNNKPTIEMIPVQYWMAMYKELTEYYTNIRNKSELPKQKRARLMEEIGQRNEELNKVSAILEAEREKEEKDKAIQEMHGKIPRVRKSKVV